jgi:hypothetical protein
MRPNVYDVDVADASLTGFASNMTGAGPWTMTTTAATDGLAHQVSVRNDSVTDHGAKTIVLTGTDQNGKVQTETINAPGTSATVESTKYFLTLTSATVSATIGADTFDFGWVDEVSTSTYPISWSSPYACNIHVDVTGTIDYTVEQTFTNVLAGEAPVWTAITAFSAKTADVVGSAAIGATAIRLIVNSYSSGAELQMYTSQPERACAVGF